MSMWMLMDSQERPLLACEAKTKKGALATFCRVHGGQQHISLRRSYVLHPEHGSVDAHRATILNGELRPLAEAREEKACLS